MTTSDAVTRLALLSEVYDAVSAGVESFEHDDRVGPDLAYLMGAILKESCCAWPSSRRIIKLLRDAFTPGHPIWDFCVVENAEETPS